MYTQIDTQVGRIPVLNHHLGKIKHLKSEQDHESTLQDGKKKQSTINKSFYCLKAPTHIEYLLPYCLLQPPLISHFSFYSAFPSPSFPFPHLSLRFTFSPLSLLTSSHSPDASPFISPAPSLPLLLSLLPIQLSREPSLFLISVLM